VTNIFSAFGEDYTLTPALQKMHLNKEISLEFSSNIYYCQFYYFVFHGLYEPEILKEYIEIEKKGIQLLMLNSNVQNDTIHLLNERLLIIKKCFIKDACFKQKCADEYLVSFWKKYSNSNKILRVEGIRLHELSIIFDITDFLKNGYFLQDVFCGYQSKGRYEYRSACLDILDSAIYYYNEAYDHETGNKKVVDYSQIETNSIKMNEFKRIYSAEEVVYKNYRETYINLLFFIESFINSIGYNAILEPNCFSADEVNRLQGFKIAQKNNRIIYSNISQKIEDISFIISGSKIDLTKYPFVDYIKQEVEIRNKYIHSSPFEEKEKINYSRINWKQKAIDLINGFAIESLLMKLWSHCYPQRRFPPFVFNGFYLGTFKGFQSKGVALN
jgi:hypothetical protein